MIEFINGVPMKNNEIAIRWVDFMLLRGTSIKVSNSGLADLILSKRDDAVTPTEGLAKIDELKRDLEQYEQFFMELSEITMDDIMSYEKKELW